MVQNPIHYNWRNFVTEDQRILEKVVINDSDDHTLDRQFLRAGPRKTISCNPPEVRAAIVTCGGLCPGYIFFPSKKIVNVNLFEFFFYNFYPPKFSTLLNNFSRQNFNIPT